MTVTAPAPPSVVLDPVAPVEDRVRPDPAGAVTVALPDPPGTWWGADADDLGAQDHAAVWALPLFEVDDLGRTVPGLAAAWREADEPGAVFAVEVDLRPGTWSDGRPVVADDVAATATALAEARPAAWRGWQQARVVDDDTVVLAFDRPVAGWPWLLSVVPGVLPAHVLAEQGLEAWDDGVPVSGGRFTAEELVPGIVSRWARHTGSPLVRPGVASLELEVVPDLDTALGRLDRGAVDLVAGHLGVGVAARAALVAGARAVTAHGGTSIVLAWGQGVDDGVRLAVAGAADPTDIVAGVLREGGRPGSGPLPGTAQQPRPPSTADGAVRLVVPRTSEAAVLMSRLVRSSATRRGVEVTLVRVDPPDHLAPPLPVDGRIGPVRRVPTPSAARLAALAGLDPSVGDPADAVGRDGRPPGGPAADAPSAWWDLDRRLVAEGAGRTLADVGVAHVWVPDRLTGVRPSGWPGLALSGIADWRVP